MENTVIRTVQMTGMRTIIAGCQAAHRRIAIRTILVEYWDVRRLETTAMEEITKAVEATKVAGGIISPVMAAVIIEVKLTK